MMKRRRWKTKGKNKSFRIKKMAKYLISRFRAMG
jgi:hypothetical protein